jgi:hypothetical protein
MSMVSRPRPRDRLLLRLRDLRLPWLLLGLPDRLLLLQNFSIQITRVLCDNIIALSPLFRQTSVKGPPNLIHDAK